MLGDVVLGARRLGSDPYTPLGLAETA
jgi:hypothetical protein